MGTRGRKSAAELAVVRFDKNKLPKPPVWLTKEQSDDWKTLVPDLVDVSRARWPLIEAYCKAAVSLRHVGQLITDLEHSDDFSIADYDKLLKMQERESRCLASLAVRLGIAQSTSYERKKKNRKQKAPWQYEG